MEAVNSSVFLTPGIALIMQAVAHPIILLNIDRQVMFSNDAANAILTSALDVVGSKPGELLNCVGEKSGPSGCGTASLCRLCGLVNTVWQAFHNSSGYAEGDCRIRTSDARGLVLHVQARRMEIGSHLFVLVSLTDIGHEERRRVLERTFFHDVLNTANVVFMTAQLLASELSGDSLEKANTLVDSVGLLIDEIQGQRILLQAEKGHLASPMALVDTHTLLKSVARSYQRVNNSNGVGLTLELPQGPCIVQTDPSLLSRVISNLVKNAFEAARTGDTVSIRCIETPSFARFEVQNPRAMPEYVRLQIFTRSFSTKGAGRGVGTYSARLLTETYLGGRIGFDSNEKEGTLFWVEIPRN